jgi:Asp/Glu/hydantoin racemase
MRIMFLNHAPRQPGERPEVSDAEVEAGLNKLASPGTKIEIHWPDDYRGARAKVMLDEDNIQNGLDHIMEALPLLRKVKWAEENGFDAVLQGNTFDPGVEGGRIVVRIPVVGVTRTSLHIAATLSERIGVTVPLACHVKEVQRNLRLYKMENFVTDVRPIGIYGRGMAKRRDEIIEITCGIIRKLVAETGAEYILPLGGALIPYVVDPKVLEQETGVPVINTKAIGIAFTEMCVRLGLTHSPLTYEHSPDLTYQQLVQYAYKDD